MNETITVKLNPAQIQSLKAHYQSYLAAKTPPYAHYQVKLSDCTITAYTSGKVVFQGAGSTFHAAPYQTSKTMDPAAKQICYPHIGSDEVGTGDVFGPVCVCAVYVEEADIGFLKELQVQDSKSLKDEQIKQIAPLLRKRLPHSLLILNNDKYNEVHKHSHLNAIKAKLHNQAYLHLRDKLHALPTIYLDQFAPPSAYFRYLQGEKEVVRDICFATKAEDKYLGVACASIIARYAFLMTMADMEARYDFAFPKGAGKTVDLAILQFLKTHGVNELHHVAKLHFRNIQNALPSETRKPFL